MARQCKYWQENQFIENIALYYIWRTDLDYVMTADDILHYYKQWRNHTYNAFDKYASHESS